jgi:hypothetical protein
MVKSHLFPEPREMLLPTAVRNQHDACRQGRAAPIYVIGNEQTRNLIIKYPNKLTTKR